MPEQTIMLMRKKTMGKETPVVRCTWTMFARIYNARTAAPSAPTRATPYPDTAVGAANASDDVVVKSMELGSPPLT